jgi:YesN/AraC family two-component response regulator
MRPVLLWIDFKRRSTGWGTGASLSMVGRVHRCSDTNDIAGLIKSVRPDVLCFDFDYPDATGLNALRNIKLGHPSLPILMFSEEASTELALWALRTRVWDFLVKPVSVSELRARLVMLSRVSERQRHRRSRDVFMPETTNLSESILGLRTEGVMPLRPAINFVLKHLHEKVSLATVAHLCGMGSCEFSRAFKHAQGMTFRDYLNQVRINEAAALLKNSMASVLDVACAVGINDPSHFARMFRRYIGHTPTAYRRRKASIRGATVASHETGAGAVGGRQPGIVSVPGG